MPKSQKEINTVLLGEIYRDLQSGKQNINNVVDKIKDSKLKRELKKEFKEYDSLSESCEDLAKTFDVILHDNNFFKKMRMWLGANFATMLDKSNKKIASMSILGSTMGVISLMSILADCKNCDDELLALGEAVLKTQENNIEKLKPYILSEYNKKYVETQSESKKQESAKKE